jgi:hypothetical protein
MHNLYNLGNWLTSRYISFNLCITSDIGPWFDGFLAVSLLPDRNQKSNIFYILACFPRLNITVRPNGKSGRASGNSLGHFEVGI